MCVHLLVFTGVCHDQCSLGTVEAGMFMGVIPPCCPTLAVINPGCDVALVIRPLPEPLMAAAGDLLTGRAAQSPAPPGEGPGDGLLTDPGDPLHTHRGHSLWP